MLLYTRPAGDYPAATFNNHHSLIKKTFKYNNGPIADVEDLIHGLYFGLQNHTGFFFSPSKGSCMQSFPIASHQAIFKGRGTALVGQLLKHVVLSS